MYGITQDFGALGGTGLTFLALALAGLAAAVIFAKDGDVSAMDDAAATTAAGGGDAGRRWPVADGRRPRACCSWSSATVTDKRYFVAGIAVVIVAVVEWMVQGWAERASADRAFNRTVREPDHAPLELPIAGALGLAVLIYGFSRVMLAVSKEAGPAHLRDRRGAHHASSVRSSPPGRSSAPPSSAPCALPARCSSWPAGSPALPSGERDELAIAAEEDHFGEDHRDCESPEPTEGDENADTAVAAKANPWATFVFDGSELIAREIAGPRPTPSRSIGATPSGFLFKNESDEEVRLTVYEGSVPVEGLEA